MKTDRNSLGVSNKLILQYNPVRALKDAGFCSHEPISIYCSKGLFTFNETECSIDCSKDLFAFKETECGIANKWNSWWLLIYILKEKRQILKKMFTFRF